MSGVGAVICEFDPLHSGHKKVIDLAKSSSDVVLAVLSGNFTQRSLPAAFDKYTRARAAVRCGVDLVVELPFPWSASGVEFYASGGVSTALSLGADSFFFGSECGSVERLEKAAAYSLSEDFLKISKELTIDPKTGAAKAIDEAYRSGGYEIGKNDKLAIEYIKSVLKSGREGILYGTVKRDDKVIGASDIRRLIAETGLSSAEEYIVPEAFTEYSSSSAVVSSADRFDQLSFLFFRFFGEADFEEIFEASGGVGNRLVKAAANSPSYKSFCSSASTKKYTDSRLRRAALYSMLGVSKKDLTVPPSFTYLLAANEKGRKYLSSLVRPAIELITKPSDLNGVSDRKQIALENRADELYSLCSDPPSEKGRFIKASPYIE